jgi:hypothetical protein
MMAVETPPQAVGERDVPVRPGDLRAVCDGAIVGILQVPLLERTCRLLCQEIGSDIVLVIRVSRANAATCWALLRFMQA